MQTPKWSFKERDYESENKLYAVPHITKSFDQIQHPLLPAPPKAPTKPGTNNKFQISILSFYLYDNIILTFLLLLLSLF